MIYRARTGVPWRDLPAEFGAWQTVHRRFQRWSVDGTLDRVLGELVADADASGELERAVSVDFSSGVDDYNGAPCPHGRMRIAVGSVR